MKVKVSELRTKVEAGVKKLGYAGSDATTIADVLMYAQLRGNNQGITKIATGGVPKAGDIEQVRVVKENKCGALLSGGHSMVATAKAATMAIDLAEKHGVGIVGSNHAFSSSGAIGYFAKQIAEAGYIGVIFRGTPPFVAPHNSAEPKLGTNPFSYAFPTSGAPIVFDMATSIIAGYGVIEAKLTGEPLPDNIAFDKFGKSTTDAAQVWPDGSIVTFGGYKGFGLSLLTQLLGGPFVGAAFLGLHTQEGPGTFVLAIDPSLLVDKQQFLSQVDEFVAAIKSVQPLPNTNGVVLPGERGDALAEKAQASGEIDIADAIWQELCTFVEA